MYGNLSARRTEYLITYVHKHIHRHIERSSKWIYIYIYREREREREREVFLCIFPFIINVYCSPSYTRSTILHQNLFLASWLCLHYHYFRSSTVKVKYTLVQALRLCTGRTAHRGSRGIALLFVDRGTRRGWGVSVTPRPLFTPRKTLYPLYRRLGGPQGRSGQVFPSSTEL